MMVSLSKLRARRELGRSSKDLGSGLTRVRVHESNLRDWRAVNDLS